MKTSSPEQVLARRIVANLAYRYIWNRRLMRRFEREDFQQEDVARQNEHENEAWNTYISSRNLLHEQPGVPSPPGLLQLVERSPEQALARRIVANLAYRYIKNRQRTKKFCKEGYSADFLALQKSREHESRNAYLGSLRILYDLPPPDRPIMIQPQRWERQRA